MNNILRIFSEFIGRDRPHAPLNSSLATTKFPQEETWDMTTVVDELVPYDMGLPRCNSMHLSREVQTT